MRFALLVKRYREAQKLPLKTMGAFFGVSHQRVADIERGKYARVHLGHLVELSHHVPWSVAVEFAVALCRDQGKMQVNLEALLDYPAEMTQMIENITDTLLSEEALRLEKEIEDV